MEYKTRIKEVVYKDESRVYYPQIMVSTGNLIMNKWNNLRLMDHNSEVVIWSNDYRCECSSSKEAIDIILLFKEQQRVSDQEQQQAFKTEREKQESIKEINYL